MAPHQTLFGSITSHDLVRVRGGASRVTSRSSGSSDQLTTMLTQITSSIKDLATNKGGTDPTMMMMMMMMMGGGGGGGSAAAAPAMAAPPPPPPQPVVNISTSIRH
jgi:hypothetical protein